MLAQVVVTLALQKEHGWLLDATSPVCDRLLTQAVVMLAQAVVTLALQKTMQYGWLLDATSPVFAWFPASYVRFGREGHWHGQSC